METKIKTNNKAPSEMEIGELVLDYASLDFAKKRIDSRLKIIREPLIEAVKKSGTDKTDKTKTYGTPDASISVEKRVLRAVNHPELIKICKRKDIIVGECLRTLTPKKANIPASVLKTLDKYFVIEEIYEASTKEVDEAVRLGILTKGDYKKIVSEKDSYALKASLGEKAAKEVFLN